MTEHYLTHPLFDEGKRVARGRGRSMEVKNPSEEDLRKTICEILKEVDFNTVSYSDNTLCYLEN